MRTTVDNCDVLSKAKVKCLLSHWVSYEWKTCICSTKQDTSARSTSAVRRQILYGATLLHPFISNSHQQPTAGWPEWA